MSVQPFINKTPNYSAGVASVANGSRTVTFSGANLIQTDATTNIQSSVCSVGDRFNVGGVASGVIESIDSPSQITLDVPWSGATQSGVAYTIYRYSTPAQGVVLAAANAALSQGQDTNPDLSRTVDDGTARLKLRLKNGAASIAVGATGAADAALVEGVDISPAGVASFPNGAVPPADWSNNRVTNGGHDVWQAGTTLSQASGGIKYTADQWMVGNWSTGATAAITKATAPAGFSSQFAMNISVPGAATGGQIQIIQPFESQSLVDFDSAASVVSFDVNAATSAGSLVGMFYILGCTAIDNGQFTNQLFAAGFTIPVGSGRVSVSVPTGGAAGVKYGAQLLVSFYQVGAPGNINIAIGAVKWEKGKVASPWSPKPTAQEWRDCQWFYEIVSLAGLKGVAVAANKITFSVPYLARKRSAPTISLLQTSVSSANSDIALNGAASWASASNMTLPGDWGVAADRAAISVAGFSGLTVGQDATGNKNLPFFALNCRL